MNDQMATSPTQTELKALMRGFFAEAMQFDTDTLLQFVKRAELTLPLLTLLCLVERRDAVPIGELGAGIDCSVANASLLVDKLVCHGYVTRVEDPSDRRQKLVQLSVTGRALLTELRATRADAVAQQLRHLPPDVVQQTCELLQQITTELRQRRAAPLTETVAAAQD